MIPVEFTTEAQNDLFEAVEYYDSREVGLGDQFANEISTVLHAAAGAPFLWRMRKEGYRRINCPAFPHFVAYVVRDDCLVVLAVASSIMKPGYWTSGRLDN